MYSEASGKGFAMKSICSAVEVKKYKKNELLRSYFVSLEGKLDSLFFTIQKDVHCIVLPSTGR